MMTSSRRRLIRTCFCLGHAAVHGVMLFLLLCVCPEGDTGAMSVAVLVWSAGVTVSIVNGICGYAEGWTAGIRETAKRFPFIH